TGSPKRLLSLPAAGHYDARSRGGSFPVSVGAGYQGRLLRGAFYSDLFPGAPAGRYQPLAVRTGRGVGDLSPDRHQYADPLPACGLSLRRAAAFSRLISWGSCSPARHAVLNLPANFGQHEHGPAVRHGASWPARCGPAWRRDRSIPPDSDARADWWP